MRESAPDWDNLMMVSRRNYSILKGKLHRYRSRHGPLENENKEDLESAGEDLVLVSENKLEKIADELTAMRAGHDDHDSDRSDVSYLEKAQEQADHAADEDRP